MKKREIEQLKTKTLDQLEEDLTAHRERLRVLKFDLKSGKVKNVGSIREIKKIIARILTFIKNLSKNR